MLLQTFSAGHCKAVIEIIEKETVYRSLFFKVFLPWPIPISFQPIRTLLWAPQSVCSCTGILSLYQKYDFICTQTSLPTLVDQALITSTIYIALLCNFVLPLKWFVIVLIWSGMLVNSVGISLWANNHVLFAVILCFGNLKPSRYSALWKWILLLVSKVWA